MRTTSWLEATSAAACMLALSTPAAAHGGGHGGMSFAELIAHVAEGWHLALAIGGLVAMLAVIAVSRAQARALRVHSKKGTTHDPR